MQRLAIYTTAVAGCLLVPQQCSHSRLPMVNETCRRPAPAVLEVGYPPTATPPTSVATRNDSTANWQQSPSQIWGIPQQRSCCMPAKIQLTTRLSSR